MPPFASLVGCWLLNGFWPLIGQDGLRHFSTPLFYHAGMALALLAFLPSLARAGRWRAALSARMAKPLVLMSALSGTASLIYLEALRYTSPANAAVMAQIEVLYSALLSAWLLGERIGPRQAAASCLVVAGTGLIMAHDLGSLRWKGDLMILLTPWLYQLSHVVAKRLPKDIEPATVTGARILYMVALLVPVTLLAAARGGARWSLSGEALWPLLLQGLLMNGAAVFFWYAAILRMDLAKATAFLLSYPALTMLFSWGLGRESISALQVAGLAVTLAGAWWLSRISRTAGELPGTSGDGDEPVPEPKEEALR